MKISLRAITGHHMFLGLVLLAGVASIACGFSKVGTTAAPFLKIEFGARAVAMGGSFVALADDPTGVYYNPAGIVELQGTSLAGGHTVWFADLDYNYASFVLPTRRVNVCMWGSFLTSEQMEITTIEQPEGTDQYFQYSDALIAMSAAAFLSDRLSIGISGKYIQQTLYHESASTFALDIGSILRTPLRGMRMGLVLTNYGGRMQLAGNDLVVQTDPWPEYSGNPDAEARLSTESFPLPLAFKIGFALDLVGSGEALIVNKAQSVTFVLDGIHPNDGEEKVQMGCEYGMFNTLFLRVGYKVNYDTQRFATGAGVRVPIGGRNIAVDYAFVDMGVLDSTHRISLALGF